VGRATGTRETTTVRRSPTTASAGSRSRSTRETSEAGQKWTGTPFYMDGCNWIGTRSHGRSFRDKRAMVANAGRAGEWQGATLGTGRTATGARGSGPRHKGERPRHNGRGTRRAGRCPRITGRRARLAGRCPRQTVADAGHGVADAGHGVAEARHADSAAEWGVLATNTKKSRPPDV
jgi:hypothetical protein